MRRSRSLLVVTTRDERAGSPFARILEASGARLWSLPTTRAAVAPSAVDRLRRDLARPSWDWIAVTSPRAASILAPLIPARSGCDAAPPPGIAAIGPATASRLRAQGVKVDVVPRTPSARALARAILSQLRHPRQARVLWPRAADSLPDLRAHLERAGVAVIDPVVYATVPYVPPATPRLVRRLSAGAIDAVCFYAPSAVRGLASAMTATQLHLLDRTCVASFGPSTSAALRALGVAPALEATRADSPAFARAVVKRIVERRGRGRP